MTPKLAITTAVLAKRTLLCGEVPQLIDRCLRTFIWDSPDGVKPWKDAYETLIRYNYPGDNLGVTGSLQWLYENTTAPIIAFLHSDVEIFEQGWDERVLREFDDAKVGVVGFGGSLGHGDPDIYKVPYRLQQLRRIDYLSNTNDAEAHGDRFTGSCEIAALDGFALIIRRELLDKAGGWPVQSLPFHSYDYWATITAHKLGYKVRLCGIEAHHWGGQTATTPAYQEWSLRVLGKSDAQVHEDSHRFIYDYARGCLPWKVPCLR